MNAGNSDGTTSKLSPAHFAETHWSVVVGAKSGSLTALNTLCVSCRAPLIAWLRARGETAHDAEDLVHGFFAHLLTREFLRNVAREKGRFRTFLLAAFKHYLQDQHKRAGAAKRGGGRPVRSLDETDGAGQPLHRPASGEPTPDQEYDRAWAATVLRNAMKRLAAECERTGHGALCVALQPGLFAEVGATGYAQIASALRMTEGAVKMAASRMRQRLKGLIRDEVRETVGSAEDLEEELRYLRDLFGKSGPPP